MTDDDLPALTGPVEVVAWLPGWETARQLRNPDTVAVTSMAYTPPVERVCTVTLGAGQVADVGFSVP